MDYQKMNIDEVNEKYNQLTKTVKLENFKFDIVRDPLTNFLYDKTITSDLLKAKQKRALVEVMKIYRTDLEYGWEKFLNTSHQSSYRNKAQELFKKGDITSLEVITLYHWSKQLKVEYINEIFEPKNFKAFSYSFWADFETDLQENQSLISAFSKIGLGTKDESFRNNVYFYLNRNMKSGNPLIAPMPVEQNVQESRFQNSSRTR